MNTKNNKPNIRVPEGFDLHFNTLTGNWTLRPIKGFSEKYLTRNSFAPLREKEATLFEDNVAEEETTRNNNLAKAKREKNDEFYTRLEDITAELRHYKEYFKGKVIYCPCDKLFNIGQSNFGKYFLSQFHELGIKKLICTQWNPNGVGLVKEYDFITNGFKWEYNGEKQDNEPVDESDINIYLLDGDGSFDSDECREIMKNCDIVITNPPFSLFRQFVAQIMEYEKKFIILGNMNAITYKEIFPLIKDNKIWLGYRSLGSDMFFELTDDYKKEIVNEKKEGSGWRIIDGEVMGRVANACWYTNIEHSKRKEELYLSKKYNEADYPKYDNYDAIEVSRVDDIPMDYDGVMGVPISFLGKYCPTQFEIVGWSRHNDLDMDGGYWLGGCNDATINDKIVYRRILIRRKPSN